MNLLHLTGSDIISGGDRGRLVLCEICDISAVEGSLSKGTLLVANSLTSCSSGMVRPVSEEKMQERTSANDVSPL